MKANDFRKYYIIEGDYIGQGAFGTVYKARKKDTKEIRAIKVIDIKKFVKDSENNGKVLSEKEIKDFIDTIIKEINVMQILEGQNHENKNTVKFYEYYYKQNIEIAIVMELCDENLSKMIGKKENKKLTFDEIRNILHQLNNTFKIMVNKKIAHRDLKPQNILVKYQNKNDKTNYIIKLCDYGVSKKLEMTKGLLSRIVGTMNFMAPEILFKNDKFDLKCDLWSLGIIIYYLYFGVNPFGEYEIAYYHNIKNEGQEDFDFSNNKDFDDLIRKLLIKDPEKRISWEDFFNHPFLKINQNIINQKIDKKYLNNKKIFEKYFRLGCMEKNYLFNWIANNIEFNRSKNIDSPNANLRRTALDAAPFYYYFRYDKIDDDFPDIKDYYFFVKYECKNLKGEQTFVNTFRSISGYLTKAIYYYGFICNKYGIDNIKKMNEENTLESGLYEKIMIDYRKNISQRLDEKSTDSIKNGFVVLYTLMGKIIGIDLLSRIKNGECITDEESQIKIYLNEKTKEYLSLLLASFDFLYNACQLDAIIERLKKAIEKFEFIGSKKGELSDIDRKKHSKWICELYDCIKTLE